MNQKKPKANSRILFQPKKDGCLLLNERNGKIHSLNAAAALIWTFCDGNHTPEEIEQALFKERGDSLEKIKCEVEKTLLEFKSLGLIE